jgi:hypothetical protein
MAMEIAGRGARGLDDHGDLGESTLDSDNVIRSQPTRTSTSSSKFRELGIIEGEDWIETMGRTMGKTPSSRKMRVTEQAQEREEAHKPWWTELLCGCQHDYDDDEQVSLILNDLPIDTLNGMLTISPSSLLLLAYTLNRLVAQILWNRFERNRHCLDLSPLQCNKNRKASNTSAWYRNSNADYNPSRP